jgi:cytochrome c-type biogenesis protein CcmF
MMLATVGQILQGLSLIAAVVSIFSLWLGHVLEKPAEKDAATPDSTPASKAEQFTNAGYLLSMVTTLMLTICVALLLFAFFTNNYSLEYVARYHSDAGWFFKLAGLWGGRQGSLLFWAWLVSLFTTWVARRRMQVTDDLSNMAIMVAQLVLAAFMGVLVFSSTNNPFIAINPLYLDASGNLVGPASAWGMNALLEHWAMAIHPPTLFVGYAGLTIPFAYAIAALITNDPSKRWVEFSTRVTVFSWLFLGIGIGLGAVWAYVVLGWGGYWGWDPVENASFLPWLVGVALLHTFTVYRRRGAFKRWAVMCACISFSFVILGTFITRSGIVESVHAFDGDPVSLTLFLVMIIASLLVGIAGLILRWKSFESDDEISSLASKDAAYYFNNAIMVIAAILLAYLTISSALPEWLWFGGQKLSAGTFNTIARPLGILYCLILAVCPLLGWGKTQGKDFWRKIRIPALCALVLFIGLMVVFFSDLLPIYQATLAGGGSQAEELMNYGPAWYYNGLAIVGLLVACLIFCNTLFLFIRGASERARNKREGFFKALLMIFYKAPIQVGGYLSHLGIAIILMGLIGSSMYVSETRATIDNTPGTRITAERYTLEYAGLESAELPNGNIRYDLHFKVMGDDDRYLGSVAPGMEIVTKTQQQKMLAGVLGFPLRDVFVVFNGVDDAGKLSIDVKVNPLINWVWIGFGLLCVGPLVSSMARRHFSSEKETLASDGGNDDDGVVAIIAADDNGDTGDTGADDESSDNAAADEGSKAAEGDGI